MGRFKRKLKLCDFGVVSYKSRFAFGAVLRRNTEERSDISKGIGRKKAAQIKDTGANVLATGCPACMIQISDMLSQAGADIAVRHPIELFAEALDE